MRLNALIQKATKRQKPNTGAAFRAMLAYAVRFFEIDRTAFLNRVLPFPARALHVAAR